MRNVLPCIALFTALAVLPSTTTVAGTGHVELRCWVHSPGAGTDPTFALEDPDVETAAATKTQSDGWLFTNTEDTEVQCTWVVPGNYDGEGSVPQVRFFGWPTSNVICGVGCVGTHAVGFDVASRSYWDEQTATEAWSSNNHHEMVTSAGTCGGYACIPADVVQLGVIDAADDADDWNDGQLIFIRIRRVTSLGDETNLSAAFHVATVFLDYPTD